MNNYRTEAKFQTVIALGPLVLVVKICLAINTSRSIFFSFRRRELITQNRGADIVREQN